MERRAFLVELDDSGSESLSDSAGSSETESLVESVGSVETEGGKRGPESSRQVARSERQRKTSKAQFMHFFKEMRGVPVQAAWEFIRDHRMMAALIPGVMEGFDYLEGTGGTGSVYAANYTPQCSTPGEDKYVLNKVEVSDDASKLYAVRCVGGKYQRRYHLYLTYTKVLPHEVLGDSSSMVVWRLEYELINPDCPLPLDTKKRYMTIMDLIRNRHKTMNRVERPFAIEEEELDVAERLRSQAGQQRLTGVEEQEVEDPSQEHGRRSRAQRNRNKNDDGSDRESRKNLRPWRTASNKFRAGGSGLFLRRRPPQFPLVRPSTSLPRTTGRASTSKPSCSLTCNWKARQTHPEHLWSWLTVDSVI